MFLSLAWSIVGSGIKYSYATYRAEFRSRWGIVDSTWGTGRIYYVRDDAWHPRPSYYNNQSIDRSIIIIIANSESGKGGGGAAFNVITLQFVIFTSKLQCNKDILIFFIIWKDIFNMNLNNVDVMTNKRYNRIQKTLTVFVISIKKIQGSVLW